MLRIIVGMLLCSTVAALAAERPNVLVILTDDQRWDASCTGNPYLKTPAVSW